ncbi:acyl carrier protein [Streptomyces sp. NPDC101227]|uniref:acyl carrier protein n=1 Tax=Streptomyces sp. NPDC101227 TaxID=3366136 RepID=UPI003823D023
MTSFALTDLSELVRSVTDDATRPDLDETQLDTSMEALGVDSMWLIDLAHRLHKDHGVPFPGQAMVDLATPRLVLDYVNRHRSPR